MDLAFFRLMFDYKRWAAERVLAQVASLGQDQYTAEVSGLSQRTVQGMLGHCLGAEVIWLARSQGVSPQAILSGQDFPTVEPLRSRWEQAHAEQAAFLATLSDAQLERPVTYWTMAGQDYTHPVAYMLAHLVNHTTQALSESAVGLTYFGHSPGDLDLIVYLRTSGAR